ncbi:hypothetical protein JCM5350_004002 [Sporobolomyces pararoseus]
MSSILASAQDIFYALIGSCCKTDATLKLNGRSFKILKLLGEGGFSYVYLAQDQESKRLFALKKIRCPLGSDSVKTALKEVEAYKRFRHENIIRCLDSCVVQDREGDGKIIYLFLPYYKNATVQHVITSHHVNGTHYPESQILELFLGTCRAVKAMHQHNSNTTTTTTTTTTTDAMIGKMKGKRKGPASISSKGKGKGKAKQSYPPASTTEEEFELAAESDSEDEEEEEDGLRSGEREGEALIGGLEATRNKLAEATIEDEEEGIILGRVGERSDDHHQTGNGITPWAHRDIKPANIMISDDGKTPILMDFGSCLPARIEIKDRRTALVQQDLAAEHCSMPFRAPELFDVKTGTTLTEAVDVWSLGCTLYSMAYSTSPFETSQESSHGGSIAMAVLNGKFSFPENEGNYSMGFKEIVNRCLKVDSKERPDIDEVIQLTESALSRLR